MIRLLLLAMGCAILARPMSAQTKEIQALQDAVHQVIEDAEPSIACILISRSERYREFDAGPSGEPGKLGGFDPGLRANRIGDPALRERIRRLDLANADPVPESYGSGVVVDSSGLILTHFHVVENATKIYVRIGKKGSYADILAADGRSDFAILKMIVPPPNLKPIKMGDGGKVRKGDFVVGIAHPFAIDVRDGGAPASHGIIGNLRRRATSTGDGLDRSRSLHQLGTLMQTDLRLNLGCSGGAVLNLKGELIGLTSSMAAILGGETPGGFAVPMDANMRRIIDVLKRGEEVEYGFLGVGVNNRDGIERNAAIIDHVSEGSPASRAGLMRFETIVAINGVPIEDYDDLFLNIGAALAGSEVSIALRTPRGEKKTVSVRLSKFKNPSTAIASNRPSAVHGIHVDYGSVVNAESIPDGVFIREIDRDSAADRKYRDVFDRGRWMITSVNGKAVSIPADFYREVKSAKGPLELKIIEIARSPEFTGKTLTLP